MRKIVSWLSWRCVFFILLGMVLWQAVSTPSTLLASEEHYQNGSLINLASVRGTKASASENLSRESPPPALLLHKVEGEIRYAANYGPCWWMMELPASYQVAGLRLEFRNVIKSVGFRVKLAAKAPADWSTVPVAASYRGSFSATPGNTGVAMVMFNSAPAKFVRIEIKGYNGGEKVAGKGAGHADLVISGLQVWGPNDPPVSPAISLAQSAWAGGSCTLHDCSMDEHGVNGTLVSHPPRDCPGAVDENARDSSPPIGGEDVVTFFTRGSPSGRVAQTDAPASFVVTLPYRTRVAGVAYAAALKTRPERPRDVEIYTSPFGLGDNWTLQKRVKDIQGGEYEEISLDRPALAQRVRFDIDRVWNPQVNAGLKAAEGHLSELYVYGNALPQDVTYKVKVSSQVSSQILDPEGRVIRTLARPRLMRPGTYNLIWDGLDDLGNKMAPGAYQARVILNPTIYSTAGAIGNTALPPSFNQNPSHIESVAVDASGNVYTANGWEEAVQDFRKWDRDTGQHVFDAQGSIRNGHPNGLPWTVAVDDKYIYCATTAHAGHEGEQHIRRFYLLTGKGAPFGGMANGHILIHARTQEQIPAGTPPAMASFMTVPRALAVAGGKLFVADTLGGKVLNFDRETGALLGSFAVEFPHALAIDSIGQLWVGHENGKVTVYDQNGGNPVEALKELGFVKALAFGPDHLLYLADKAASQVRVYRVDEEKKAAVLVRTVGGPAKPGDDAPDCFYQLSGLAVDAGGNLTVAQNLPVNGSRLTRFTPEGKVIWDQLGAEFCDAANYSQERPNEVISQYFHRYEVDKKTGAWQFRGSVLDGDPKYINFQHGAMRFLKLGGNEFAFQAYGDGLQVYRRDGEVYRLASMFGSANPFPNGVYRAGMSLPNDQRPLPGLWTWHDANGNGKVDEAEVTWVQAPDKKLNWYHFGINVDQAGNALLCGYDNNVREIPVSGLDQKGNPIYDLAHSRVVVPRDTAAKPLLADPIMAVRADDGSIYVLSRSKVYPAPPESALGWMAGWMLARYDMRGQRLWAARLPTACPGMDYVPGGGVMLVSIKWGRNGSEIYHYSADGALIGVTSPSEKFRGKGGIPDNTASLCLSRDPSDGILDMFVEDCIGNRFRWLRADDRTKTTVAITKVILTKPGTSLKVDAGG